MNSRRRGDEGEARARAYLVQAGWTVLAQNVVFPGGELDLVALDGDCIVFVEVKARHSTRYGTGAEAVTPTKIRRILTAAQQYLYQHQWQNRPVRFDVVELRGEVLHHIQSAFDATGFWG